MVIYLSGIESIIIDNSLLAKKLYYLSEACKASNLEIEYIDVRLRVFDYDWQLLSGDPQYDTDHRGYWGYGSLQIGSSEDECRELAIELQNDLANNIQD